MPSVTRAITTIYSFVVDSQERFYYQAWHLARSLVRNCGADPGSIFVCVTPEVGRAWRDIFVAEGYTVREIERFGDGKYCNKLCQLDTLADVECDTIVLLDTDMIVLGDLRAYLLPDFVQAKVVNLPVPRREILDEIVSLAGFSGPWPLIFVDAAERKTHLGNSNGGLYAIPKSHSSELASAWKKWALWLLDRIEILGDKFIHVDQVSFYLALRELKLPFDLLPSNLNRSLNLVVPPRWLDADLPVVLIHYHNRLNVLGKISMPEVLDDATKSAVDSANRLIDAGFDNRLFWPFRYAMFPERGSGLGSRGENLEYKRDLLVRHGVETAASVIDFGCGDLEVVKPLNIANYIGLDQSVETLSLASSKRPDWKFALAQDNESTADLVLCFEVLIHQSSRELFEAVVADLVARTKKTLIVSGYAEATEHIAGNHIVFFHEPLADALARPGRFSTIQEIGRHTDVVIYRCDV